MVKEKQSKDPAELYLQDRKDLSKTQKKILDKAIKEPKDKQTDD